MAKRQVGAELGNGRLIVDQLLLDLERRSLRLERLGRMPQAREQSADGDLGGRDILTELRDGGLLVRQLLPDAQGRAKFPNGLGCVSRRCIRVRNVLDRHGQITP